MTDQLVEDWEGEVGDRWLTHIDQFESMIEPIGRALIARAGFAPGQTVVDVGCGCGANSLDVARAVAPGGRVLGVDISEKLLELARRRQAAAQLANLSFERGDGQTHRPGGAPFDRLFSRFGVMFFEDTGAAFANMRRWLKPGGDLVFACWASPQLNPWIGLVGSIVGAHVEMPARDPDAPGPFRMADPDATRAMLEAAGYTDVALELWDGEQALGGEGMTPATATEFVLSALAMGEALREAGVEDQVRGEIETALIPYHRDGGVRLASTAWFVTARNPG